MKNINKIYLLGDIHGSYKPIKELSKQLDKDKNNILILLGDAGLNFYFNYRDKKLKESLEKYNLTYFVIRGNHEERPSNCIKKDPNEWHTEYFWNNEVYVENSYPHIKYALDYPAIYSIPIKNKMLKTLVLPGAYSVDKYYRLQNNWTWFPDEQCTEAEMNLGLELVKNNNKYDIILSHTSPTIYEPTDLYLSTVDQTMVDKSTERWLGQIEFLTDYKLWCFGHYHSTRIFPMYRNKQMIMLFNNSYFNLNNYITTKNPYNSLIFIE